MSVNASSYGSCWRYPIWHRRWRIYLSDNTPDRAYTYAYVHDDYDGADDAKDSRFGWAKSVDDAKAEIDEYEADL